MNARKEYLRQRREFLVLQAAAQRNEVAWITNGLQQDLRFVDTVVAVGQSVSIVSLLALATTLLARRKPRHKLLLWAGRLFAAWQLLTVVRKQWQQH